MIFRYRSRKKPSPIIYGKPGTKWVILGNGTWRGSNRTRSVGTARRLLDYWLAADILEFTSHPYGGKIYDGDNRPVEFEQLPG